jgi:hypothetical protein
MYCSEFFLPLPDYPSGKCGCKQYRLLGCEAWILWNQNLNISFPPHNKYQCSLENQPVNAEDYNEIVTAYGENHTIYILGTAYWIKF